MNSISSASEALAICAVSRADSDIRSRPYACVSGLNAALEKKRTIVRAGTNKSATLTYSQLEVSFSVGYAEYYISCVRHLSFDRLK